MADLTHDVTEDGFHEIQLSGKQVVFLGMATTVVLVATFLCGVMVGREVGAERAEELPASTMADGATAGAGGAAAVPLGAEPLSAPAEDELSYHQRLRGTAPPDEGTPSAEVTAALPPSRAAEAQPARAENVPDVPTSGQKGTWVVQVTALQNRAAAAGIVQRLIGQGYPAFLENPAPGAPVIYRVRIGRYGERREADQIARRLEKEEQFSPVVTR